MGKCFLTVTFTAVVLVLTMLHKTSAWATESDVIRLHDNLLGNYRRQVRPIVNQSAAIDVALSFSLTSIEELDDVEQRLTISGVVTATWKDKNLVWNPADYGGIDRVMFSEEQIWAPILVSKFSSTSLEDIHSQYIVLFNGQVAVGYSGKMSTVCNLDMMYFPFDSQSCIFTFSTEGTSNRDVDIFPASRYSESFISSLYIENGEWILHNISMGSFSFGSPAIMFGAVTVKIDLERRPTSYVCNVIIPAVVLGLLGLLTFGVPAESGERLSFALTTMLALSVYIPYIASQLPKSSGNIPIVLRYLAGLIVLNASCVVLSVVVIAVRNSHVRILNDTTKIMRVFGIPFTIKRQEYPRNQPLDGLPGRENWTFQVPDKQSPYSGMSIICETGDKDEPYKLYVGTGNNNLPLNRTSQKGNYIQNIMNSLTTEQNVDSTNVQDHSSSHTDEDALWISNVINNYSFVILIFIFTFITSITFIQLATQSF